VTKIRNCNKCLRKKTENLEVEVVEARIHVMIESIWRELEKGE
jgi:hypothetical protein